MDIGRNKRKRLSGGETPEKNGHADENEHAVVWKQGRKEE
jgi:hypothetical protein